MSGSNGKIKNQNAIKLSRVVVGNTAHSLETNGEGWDDDTLSVLGIPAMKNDSGEIGFAPVRFAFAFLLEVEMEI